MTTQAVRPPGGSAVPGDQPAAKAQAQAQAAPKPKGRSSDNVVRAIGVTLTLLALLILGFVSYLYAFSGVQEARSQTELYARLQGELGQGVAPTGPVIPGHPVTPASLAAVPGDPIALLNIPAIHLKNVVIVEGTSPETMTLGPGHLRDTPFPGQGGISVVFGRRATFGAPFADVPRLKKGDLITTVTSQGPARYEVIAVSDSSKPVPFSELSNQLLLLTADSQDRAGPLHRGRGQAPVEPAAGIRVRAPRRSLRGGARP